ncbi:hypothetical protein CAPTEDRAFT_221342 [Capitella teleta]|uniref:Proline dehydrogenase n=1 Tax=Capitella teleta TaxID=283909 RepID=R7UNF8_CAPTE|nr:hypothetical protein CAPTEDRAFT_221342 [Capitella teleta]|eukprot:ELU07760.1 hypothetical protein CAPTEDRAFT_221342 [Capitella teleta]
MARRLLTAFKFHSKTLNDFHHFGSRCAYQNLSICSKRNKASTAATAQPINEQEDVKDLETTPDPAFARIDTSFDDAQEAFKSKTNSELIRAYLVLQSCAVKPLVDYNKQLLAFGRKFLGKTLFEKFMKGTFYGQFVAGKDIDEIKPIAERNKSYGVKSILDYSVEMDLSREQAKDVEMDAVASVGDKGYAANDEADLANRFQGHRDFGDRRDNVMSARTYFYKDEAMCDENLQHFINGIDAVSGATNATGFAAVKLTALGRPQFLLQLSEVLARVRRYYETLASGYGTGKLQMADFERHLKSFKVGKEERQKWFTILDITGDGEIDLLDWHNLLEINLGLAKLLQIPNLKTGKLEPLVDALTDKEEEQMMNMLRRMDTIATYGKQKDVRVMIDAEQTYFQPAINRLCMEMMRKYNKDKAIIFNTYQCYLKDAHNMITLDLALSKRENFHFGAKLVRGAYLEQERDRAATLGYEDPINPSYEATTAMYEKVLTEVMQSIQERPKGDIAVMVASHNEDTVRFTLQKMQEYNIRSTDRLICFGQLLGMCDQVSFMLGQAGYSVYKYVPYGPVEEVLPYLSRRATENNTMLAKAKKERRLLRQELLRRFASLKFFYRPTPPAVSPLDAMQGKTSA